MKSFLSAIGRLFAAILAIFAAIPGFVSNTSPDPGPEPPVRNVIYMVGDGMGVLHLEKTKYDLGIGLVMDTFPVQGRSRTRSASSDVTDSAAGATALFCGVRTNNKAVGVYPDDLTAEVSYPKNLAELCHENGMRVGVITTDEVYGATPAGCTVHVEHRDNKSEIVEKELQTPFDFIWGDETGRTDPDEVAAAGFKYVSSLAEMNALQPGDRSFGLFEGKTWKLENQFADGAEMPRLDQMAVKAVELLSGSAGDDGFFLMIEGAHIDKRSHDEDDEGMTEALAVFDTAVANMLAFAKRDRHTLVVVTADHETGGIVRNDDGSYSFTQGSHSGADVPLLVYGSEDIIADGETVDNYTIPIRIARLLGFGEDMFPAAVPVPQEEPLPQAA